MSRRRRKPTPAPPPIVPRPAGPDPGAVMLAAMVQLIRQRADKAARAVESAPPTLALGDLPPQVRRGVEEADEIRWTEHQSLSGVQRASGIIQIERNPDLSPYRARGFGADPGVWWDLRNLPETGAPLARLTREVSSTPLQLVEPTLPDWASEVDEHLAAMQLELAQRWFHAWTNDPEQHLGDVVRDLVDYAPACGFCALELTGTPGLITLSDGYTVDALIPNLPAVIAPWTARYWITQGRVFKGATFNFNNVRDRDGDAGAWDEFIPAEKLVIVSHDANGQNYEGRSAMRPVFNQLHQLRDLYKLQALGAEVHALGELWFTQAASSGTLGGTAPTLSPEVVAQLVALLDNRAAVYVPGAILPPGVEPVYGQSKANLPDLTPQIRVLREAVSLVMGDEHRLMGTTGGSGTYAARKDASAGAKEPLDFALETLVARPLETVLARFLALAFPGAPVFCPRITWGAVEDDTTEWIANVRSAREGGLLDDPDYGDQVRDALNLPPRAQTDLAGLDDPNSLPPDRFIPVANAAELFGVSAGVIRRLIATNELVGRKVGARWVVNVASIRAYLGTATNPPQPVV